MTKTIKILNKVETYRNAKWGEAETKIMKTIMELDGVVRPSVIEHKSGVSRKTIFKHINKHLEKGIAEKIARGNYLYYVGIKNLDARKTIKTILKKGILEKGYRSRGDSEHGAILQFPRGFLDSNSDWKILTYIEKELKETLIKTRNLPEYLMLVYITKSKKFKK